MSTERGIGVNELLIVIAVISLGLLATVTYTVPRVAREGLHSAVTDVHTYLQLARVEAQARGRDCRFVLDTDRHRIEVMDSAGTDTPGDDILLYKRDLSSNVRFVRPGGGAAVTLKPTDGEFFQTSFSHDGRVSVGVGDLVMLGGSEYGRIRVAANGEIRIERWDGDRWVGDS